MEFQVRGKDALVSSNDNSIVRHLEEGVLGTRGVWIHVNLIKDALEWW
jgi:hypothetical protein